MSQSKTDKIRERLEDWQGLNEEARAKMYQKHLKAQANKMLPKCLNALESVVEECEDALEAPDGFEANLLSQILLRKIANELDAEEG